MSRYSEINTFDSPAEAADLLALRMIEQTESKIREKGRCVWAVSGGSSIQKLYAALSKHEKKIRDWENKLIVIWVDERLVPHMHEDSNYGNARHLFWNRFDECTQLAVPYNQELKRSEQEYEQLLEKNNIETIDITILGMGTDGHTASLFPRNQALDVKEQKVAAVEDPSVNQS